MVCSLDECYLRFASHSFDILVCFRWFPGGFATSTIEEVIIMIFLNKILNLVIAIFLILASYPAYSFDYSSYKHYPLSEVIKESKSWGYTGGISIVGRKIWFKAKVLSKPHRIPKNEQFLIEDTFCSLPLKSIPSVHYYTSMVSEGINCKLYLQDSMAEDISKDFVVRRRPFFIKAYSFWLLSDHKGVKTNPYIVLGGYIN